MSLINSFTHIQENWKFVIICVQNQWGVVHPWHGTVANLWGRHKDFTEFNENFEKSYLLNGLSNIVNFFTVWFLKIFCIKWIHIFFWVQCSFKQHILQHESNLYSYPPTPPPPTTHPCPKKHQKGFFDISVIRRIYIANFAILKIATFWSYHLHLREKSRSFMKLKLRDFLVGSAHVRSQANSACIHACSMHEGRGYRYTFQRARVASSPEVPKHESYPRSRDEKSRHFSVTIYTG